MHVCQKPHVVKKLLHEDTVGSTTLPLYQALKSNGLLGGGFNYISFWNVHPYLFGEEHHPF